MRGRRIAALTAVLIAPSFASARALEPPPVAEFDESPADAPADAEGPSDAPPADVINPDLAAEAPQTDWIREGYGKGEGVVEDPRALNRKIRRAGRVTLAGGGIAILGGAIAITGAILLYGVRPASRLNDLRDDNMGVLPVDDDQRHRLINIARAGPIVAFTGLGVMVGGIITAAVARSRLKKLRERRRTSIVSFAPTPYGRGAEIHWEVKF
jgi:hypothetical protein